MPSLSDKLADQIVSRTVNLLRFGDGIANQIIRDLNALEKELMRDINNYAGKSSFTLARLKALLVQTRKTIATSYDKIALYNEHGMINAVELVGKQTVTDMNAVIGASVISIAWTEQQLKAIATKTLLQGGVAQDWWSQQALSLRVKFESQMRMGQLRGEGIEELTRRVIGTKAMAYKDGIMQASRAQARTLVRTHVLGVSNAVRMETYLANRDIISSVIWSSVLDNRTSEICIGLSNSEWTLPSEDSEENYSDFTPVGHNKEFPGPPPAHFSCRSTLIPKTKSWEELAGAHGNSAAAKLADKVPAGKRNSMDGLVPSETTYEDWLKTKSESEINDILGKGKADLWRSGKIGLADLTDTRNNPLTLAQLKERFGGE